jgi:LPXTG-motif cell wall-anchored protein
VDANDTGTSPALADTDDDGFNDGREILGGFDPNDPADHPGSQAPLLPGVGAVMLGVALAGAGSFGLRRRKQS